MIESKLPKSCKEHQPKYWGNAWKDYTLAELGQWVHLFVKRAGHRKNAAKRAKDLTDAQNYLNMMQAHIDAAIVTQPNELLEQLPMVETPEEAIASSIAVGKAVRNAEPKNEAEKTLAERLANHEARVADQKNAGKMPDLSAAQVGAVVEAVKTIEGPIRDDDGKVTRISVLASEPGYDPDAHENKDLKIYCDDAHIPTAHTADTVAGIVWYYEKNAKGRISTWTKSGKVEIRGL